MKISKETWHYKFWRSTLDYHPGTGTTDLCRYVQRIFWFGLFALAIGAGMLYVVSFFAYLIFYVGFWQHPALASGIAVGLVIVACVTYLVKKWRDDHRFDPRPPPSLARQWVSAKKQKICPLVEFE